MAPLSVGSALRDTIGHSSGEIWSKLTRLPSSLLVKTRSTSNHPIQRGSRACCRGQSPHAAGMLAPLPKYFSFQLPGVSLITTGLPMLLDSFVRFALQGHRWPYPFTQFTDFSNSMARGK